MTTKTIYLEGIAQHARPFEHNRDFGTNLPDGDQKSKIIEADGMYTMNLVMTPEAKKEAIAEGIPNKGMIGQRWKEDEEGNPFYKISRKHFNSKFIDKETGEPGVVQGPPKVVKVVDGKNVLWDVEEDGLIGNGSKVVAKVTVTKTEKYTVVDWQALKVVEHVEYVPDEEVDGEYF